MIRAKASAVRHTKEMATLLQHWVQVTQQKEHQDVVKSQAEFIMSLVKLLHMSEKDKEWIDPTNSPVMFDAWHVLYIYFVAVGKGDLNPMLDFVIDGKYDEKFIHEIKP
jgi:hypothetical protein